MKKVVFSITCAFLLFGCGGESSSNSNEEFTIVQIPKVKVENINDNNRTETMFSDNDIKVDTNQSIVDSEDLSNDLEKIKENITSSVASKVEFDENNVTTSDDLKEEVIYIKNRLTLKSSDSSPKCIKPKESISYLSATFNIDKNIEIDMSSLDFGVMVESVSKSMLLKLAIGNISIYTEDKQLNITGDSLPLLIHAEDENGNVFFASQTVSNIASIVEQNDKYKVTFSIAVGSALGSTGLTFPEEEDFTIFFGIKENESILEFVNFDIVQIGNVFGIDLSNSYGFSSNFSVSTMCN